MAGMSVEGTASSPPPLMPPYLIFYFVFMIPPRWNACRLPKNTHAPSSRREVPSPSPSKERSARPHTSWLPNKLKSRLSDMSTSITYSSLHDEVASVGHEALTEAVDNGGHSRARLPLHNHRIQCRCAPTCFKTLHY